jgi:hypothetical protein
MSLLYICKLKMPEQCLTVRHYTSIEHIEYTNAVIIDCYTKITSRLDRTNNKLAQSQCCASGVLCKEFEQSTSNISMCACLVVEH